jgi:hypothetical protein
MRRILTLFTLTLLLPASILAAEAKRDVFAANRQTHSSRHRLERPSSFHVEGLISQITANTLNIATSEGDFTMALSNSTVVQRGSDVLSVTQVTPGAHVLVSGWRSLGALMASRIEMIPAPPSSSLPLPNVYGQVRAIGDNQLTVSSFPSPLLAPTTTSVTIRVDSRTTIFKHGEAAPFSAIVVGDVLIAIGSFSDSSTMLAAMIDVLEAPIPIPVASGTVLEIHPSDFLMTSNLLGIEAYPVGVNIDVKVDSSTVFFKDGAPTTYWELKAGDLVQVVGHWIDASTLQATQVSILPPPPPPKPFVNGVVQSIGANELTVVSNDPVPRSSVKTVRVNEHTEIFRNFEPIPFSEIEVDDYVGASGTWVETGSVLLAERIDVIQRDPIPHFVKGTVQEIHTNELVVALDGTTQPANSSSPTMIVRVDEHTVISRDGHPISFNEIHVGERIEAEGSFVDASTLLAASINVEPEIPPPGNELFGTVASVRTDGILVQPFVVVPNGGVGTIYLVTVKVTATTKITHNGKPIALSDIHVGDLVAVKGAPIDGTTFVADSIEVMSPPPPPTSDHIQGVVAEVHSDALIVVWSIGVKGSEAPAFLVTVQVGPETVITGDGRTLTLADVHPGDFVDAEGRWSSNTVFLATKIEVVPAPPPPPARFSGQVTSVGSHELSVALYPLPLAAGILGWSVTVHVDEQTRIYRNDVLISLSEIHMGDSVRVTGTYLDDGSVHATRIDDLPQSTTTTIYGTVAEIRGTDLIISTPPMMGPAIPVALPNVVRVTSETVIMRDGAVISLADIHLGDRLQAVGTLVDQTILLAAKIAIDTSTSPST